jgi:hypothetical protein
MKKALTPFRGRGEPHAGQVPERQFAPLRCMNMQGARGLNRAAILSASPLKDGDDPCEAKACLRLYAAACWGRSRLSRLALHVGRGEQGLAVEQVLRLLAAFIILNRRGAIEPSMR